MRIPHLILFAESLDVGFAVRIKEVLAALNGTQVLTKLFHGGPAERSVAIVDLMNDKTGLEYDHVGNH
jgi:hypothetical protein